jgi:site-specific DNA-cytosine methylase
VISIGSLFSGIGGLELGLERALQTRRLAPRVSWQVEIDPFCTRVLERHWPHARRWQDVRDFATHLETYESARRLHAVDVLCGGFPCQDISVAGSGAGLAGERSGLFFDLARIVRALRPRVVVLENVSALLARGLDVVLGTMAACGYDAEWDCVPASSVGAPHQRDRVFIVAHTSDARRGGLATAAVGVKRDEVGRGQLDRGDGAAGDAADPHSDAVRVESVGEPGGGQASLARDACEGGGAAADADVQRLDVPAPRRDDIHEPARSGVDGRPRGPRSGSGAADVPDAERAGLEGAARRGHTGARREIVEPARSGGDAANPDRTPREGMRGPRGVQPQHPDAHGFRPRLVEWGIAPPAIRRVDDGLPAGVDRPRRRRPANDKHRLRALGNAVVPHVAEVVGERVARLLLAPTT